MVKRILGIDPGSCTTGFGLIDVDKRSIEYQSCGPLRLVGESAAEKLGFLLVSLEKLIDTYKPTEMAIEAIFLHKNASSALKLGQARGVALAVAIKRGLPVFEYAARQVKLAITGKGSADKTQVQYMVNQVLKIKQNLQSDAADALAIALCHAHIQTGWGAGQQEKGLTLFSRKRVANKRHYAWPSYQKENK